MPTLVITSAHLHTCSPKDIVPNYAFLFFIRPHTVKSGKCGGSSSCGGLIFGRDPSSGLGGWAGKEFQETTHKVLFY